MAKAVELRERAARDIDAIVRYYTDQRGESLALRFVDRLQAAFDHLGRHPQTGSLRLSYELGLPGLRTWPLTTFPYLVFYVDLDSSIDVWRVLHARRDLPTWLADPEA